jgi:NADH:ubiquinone oxidoreductase subunit 4 (subunit M)
MPITATLTLLGFFAIGGVPPTVGFMSKFMIFAGVFDSALTHTTAQLVVAIVAIIMTVLTVGYSLWTVRRIFFGPLAEGMEDVKEAPMLMLIPMIVLAVTALVLGVYPKLVLDYLLPFFGEIVSAVH